MYMPCVCVYIYILASIISSLCVAKTKEASQSARQTAEGEEHLIPVTPLPNCEEKNQSTNGKKSKHFSFACTNLLLVFNTNRQFSSTSSLNSLQNTLWTEWRCELRLKISADLFVTLALLNRKKTKKQNKEMRGTL